MPQTSSFHWIWVATQCCHRCHQISLPPRYISGSAALGRHGFIKEKTELEVTPSHKRPSCLMKLCVWATSLGLSDLGSRFLTAWPIPLFVWYWAPNCAAWTWHFRDRWQVSFTAVHAKSSMSVNTCWGTMGWTRGDYQRKWSLIHT